MKNVRSSEVIDIKHFVTGFAWHEMGNGGKPDDTRTIELLSMMADRYEYFH